MLQTLWSLPPQPEAVWELESGGIALANLHLRMGRPDQAEVW